MRSKMDFFFKKTLGSGFEELVKSEIYRPGTRTVTDIEEIYTGLKVVPRTLMSFFIKELSPMKIGEAKDIELPFVENSKIHVNKVERDTYNGQIEQENKKISEFMFRSVPGIALIVMSVFELYPIEDLEKETSSKEDDSKIQKLIDEKLALHSLIGQVIDKKLMERDAIKQLLMTKLTESIQQPSSEIEKLKPEDSRKEPEFLESPKKIGDKGYSESLGKSERKESPLREFLDRKKPKEFSIKMVKGECVNCDTCGKEIFNGTGFSSCVCFGDCGKVYIKKSEDGIKVSFGKNWEIDNMELLLELLRKKHGK